jgi:hypothetical protein
VATRRAQPRARRHCRHFAGGAFATACRAGLGDVAAVDRPLVVPASAITCSLALDRHLQSTASQEERWDYVLVARDRPRPGIALEVHFGAADQVPKMIDKKAQAASVLARECPGLVVDRWHWVVQAGAEVYFRRGDPAARALADAGIEFPTKRLIIVPE